MAGLNLITAWAWIVAGIGFGCFLGLSFHREDWLGGYGSFRRRLYRLAHISFFGLAILNFLFFLTIPELASPTFLIRLASWGFIVGAVFMPASCLMTAHLPRARGLFAVPVISLLAAATLTLYGVLRP